HVEGGDGRHQRTLHRQGDAPVPVAVVGQFLRESVHQVVVVVEGEHLRAAALHRAQVETPLRRVGAVGGYAHQRPRAVFPGYGTVPGKHAILRVVRHVDHDVATVVHAPAGSTREAQHDAFVVVAAADAVL